MKSMLSFDAGLAEQGDAKLRVEHLLRGEPILSCAPDPRTRFEPRCWQGSPCLVRCEAKLAAFATRRATPKAVPYAPVKPRDSFSRERPFVSPHFPNPVETSAAS